MRTKVQSKFPSTTADFSRVIFKPEILRATVFEARLE
jgi:hypothetical protein